MRENSKRFSWLILASIVVIIISGTASAQSLQVYLDIKPGTCLNPLNVKSKGMLTIAILGTEDFWVSEIDRDSLRLLGELAPIRVFEDDVSSPPESFECGDCPGLEPDEIMDLVLKFKTEDVVRVLGLWSDDLTPLSLTGMLSDGTEIVGEDCVLPLHVSSLDIRISDETKNSRKTVGRWR